MFGRAVTRVFWAYLDLGAAAAGRADRADRAGRAPYFSSEKTGPKSQAKCGKKRARRVFAVSLNSCRVMVIFYVVVNLGYSRSAIWGARAPSQRPRSDDLDRACIVYIDVLDRLCVVW